MSEKELNKELESLRAEVAALAKARSENRPEETSPEPVAQVAATADVVETASIDTDDPDAVQNQMDKLLAQLEHEVSDMPAVTTLAVFSLGVLFGRLLR